MESYQVFAAMAEEIKPILGRRNRLRHCTGATPIGVGKIQAALATLESAKFAKGNDTGLILVGSAGALAPDLLPGDIIISRDAVFHDVDATPLGFARGQIPFSDKWCWLADQELIKRAKLACAELGLEAKIGRMLTGDCFIADRREAEELLVQLHGLSVDWETAAVAMAAEHLHLPWVSIRVVTDYADSSADLEFQQNLIPAAHILAEIIERIDANLRPEAQATA